jgi:hypothetical protein
MVGGGGAAAAIIAAKQRRVQEAVDAFRLGDATAPDRARRLEELGLMASDETRDLLVEGVLRPGHIEGTYYLSEPGYIYRRNDRKGLRAIAIISALLVIIGFLVFGYAVGRA